MVAFQHQAKIYQYKMNYCNVSDTKSLTVIFVFNTSLNSVKLAYFTQGNIRLAGADLIRVGV